MIEITRKNPVSYVIVAAIAAAIALPLAIATSNTESGDLFVECFADECETTSQFASLTE